MSYRELLDEKIKQSKYIDWVTALPRAHCTYVHPRGWVGDCDAGKLYRRWLADLAQDVHGGGHKDADYLITTARDFANGTSELTPEQLNDFAKKAVLDNYKNKKGIPYAVECTTSCPYIASKNILIDAGIRPDVSTIVDDITLIPWAYRLADYLDGRAPAYTKIEVVYYDYAA